MKYILFFILSIQICFGQTIIDQNTKDTIVITQKIISVPTIEVTKKPYIAPPPTTTTNFSPVKLVGYFARPAAGAEYWNDQGWNDVEGVNITTGYLDIYYRFPWRFIQSSSRNVFDWTVFDRKVNEAITGGKKFSFGITATYEGSGPSVGGAALSYPDYLHTQMQSETNKDWAYGGSWVPNWNSNYYLTALEELLNAVANHINTTSYNGVAYKNAINYIDVRGYGNFGEWHNYPWYQNQPAGRVATVATLNRIIDAHIKAFPNIKLIAMSDAFNGGGASQIPTEITYRLLTVSNTWGQLGWRRDNWGNPGYDNILANNTGSYNGVAFKDLIINKWKNAPIVGEPWRGNSGVNNNGAQCPYYDLDREVKLYHATSFGNGNYENITSCMKTNIINASGNSGYKLEITSGAVTATSNQLNITINWVNNGITPSYEDWNVIFDIAGIEYVSKFKPKLFIGETTITESFNVLMGSYSIKVSVKDVNGYRKPMPLNIVGRNADGSYTLAAL